MGITSSSPSQPTGSRARSIACARLRQTLRWWFFASVVSASLMAQAADEVTPPKPTLGTLFYTNAERSSISRARLDTGQVSEAGEPVANVLSVTGLVKRQGGHSTVWINGQPVSEGESISQGKHLSTTPGGIRLDGTGVRVGESLDLTTRERTDIVQPGAVTIKKR